MDLKPVTYELISTPGKTQCGLIAQWVKEAMDKNGISENEFALYEHDIREDSYFTAGFCSQRGAEPVPQHQYHRGAF